MPWMVHHWCRAHILTTENKLIRAQSGVILGPMVSLQDTVNCLQPIVVFSSSKEVSQTVDKNPSSSLSRESSMIVDSGTEMMNS